MYGGSRISTGPYNVTQGAVRPAEDTLAADSDGSPWTAHLAAAEIRRHRSSDDVWLYRQVHSP